MKTSFLIGLFFILSPVFSATEKPELWTVEIGGLWTPPKAVHFTGFGPFGYIKDNPSGRIVHRFAKKVESLCSEGLTSVHSTELKVFPGVIETIEPALYSTVISVGVSAGSSAIRLERFAENWYEDDNQEGVIDPNFPPHHFLEGPKLPSQIPTFLEGFEIALGQKGTAGTFVCNDTFFRLCRNQERGHFIHIPNIQKDKDEAMVSALAQITCQIFSDKRR